MNHQPFRDWLLSGEKLSTDEIHELQEHMQSCESCRQTDAAWHEVESVLRGIPQVEPAPGFTNRWQAHLAAHLEQKQKRRGWIMIGLDVVMIGLLFGLIANQIWSLIQMPGPFLVTWFTRLFSLVTLYYTLQDMFGSFSGSIPFIILVGMFFLFGIVSLMSVLWLATYRKLIFVRRIL